MRIEFNRDEVAEIIAEHVRERIAKPGTTVEVGVPYAYERAFAIITPPAKAAPAVTLVSPAPEATA